MKCHPCLRSAAVLLITAALLFAPSSGSAEIPNEIHYQGRLTDAQGAPVTGEVDITVRLFDAGENGGLLYEEALGDVAVANGVYHFRFGAVGAGIGEALNAPEAWLELAIDSEAISPRSRLLAVPYAMRAAEADVAKTAEEVTGNVPGTFTWQDADAGSPTIMQGDTGYIARSDIETTEFILPTDLAIGATVRISAQGDAGWRILQGDGQRILVEDILAVASGDASSISWNEHFTDQNRNWYDVAISADGTVVFACIGGSLSTERRIYRSVDGGATWTTHESLRFWNTLATSHDGQTVIAGVSGSNTTGRDLYLSTDGGNKWSSQGINHNWQGVAMSADGSVIAATAWQDHLYLSDDGGATWNPHEGRHTWRKVSVSDDGSVIFAAIANGLPHLSLDGGETWQTTQQARNWHAAAVSGDGQLLAAGVSGGFLYLSRDQGSTWETHFDDASRIWRSITCSADGSVIVAAASNEEIYHSVDGGQTWHHSAPRGGWFGIAATPDGRGLAAASFEGTLFTGKLQRTTAFGTDGYLTGAKGSSVELQYLGDGIFAPVQSHGALGTESRSMPDAPAYQIASWRIPDGSLTGSQIAPASISAANLAATAQPGHVLVANSAGELMWRPLNEIVAMQDYQFQPQAFPGNIAELDINVAGIGTIFGEMIHGPGFIIDRLPNAHPINSNYDYPGLNQEIDVVFDYDGPAAGALSDWHLSGVSGSFTIKKREADGQTIMYEWFLQNFRLAAINPSPTGKGNRYTLVSTTGPDSVLDMNRSDGNWESSPVRSGDFNAPELEISGVPTGKYPEVTFDPVAKTITIDATFRNGGGLFLWARNIAMGIADLRVMSLIYRSWPSTISYDAEIGRNNFYDVFPIRYQQVGGFSAGSLPREQLVLAYGTAENAEVGTVLPLYSPPTVETFPAEGGTQLARDVNRNRMQMDLEGGFTTYAGLGTLSDMPILIQGPGYQIEREGMVNNRFSGNNRKFPFIFDLPNSSVHLPSVHDVLQQHLSTLPEFYSSKVISIIGFANGEHTSTEIYRFNLFEYTPHSITDLGDGYSRCVFHYWHPPGMLGGMESQGSPQGNDWGISSNQIDSDLDRRVQIAGIADFYPEVTDDPEARTLTLWHNQGEGGQLFNWTRLIAIQGTAVHGKNDVLVFAENGITPVKNYFGCFPIEWQLVDGVERAPKGRVRVVLSYDFAEDS